VRANGKEDGTLLGSNDHGQLGYGNTEDIADDGIPAGEGDVMVEG
jgi:hypothetical protein